MLAEMEMSTIFDTEIRVPPIGSITEIMAVVEEQQLYSRNDAGYKQIESTLQKAGYAEEGSVMIGVDRLLTLVDRSRQFVEDPGGCSGSDSVRDDANSPSFTAGKLSNALLETLRL
jgi:vesicle-fusing ATPase